MVLATLIVVCGLLFLYYGYRSAAVGQSGFHVKVDTVDLGEVAHTNEITASFPFVNNAHIPVTVLDINSTCSCTVAELAKRSYDPGESGTIDVVVQLRDIGPVSQNVAVTTDASPDPIILEVRAFYKPSARVVAMPPSVTLRHPDPSGDSGEGAVEVQLDILALEATPLSIRDMKSKAGRVSAVTVGTPEEPRRTASGYYRNILKIQVSPMAFGEGDDARHVQDVLIVSFTPEVAPDIHLPVSIIRPRVRASAGGNARSASDTF